MKYVALALSLFLVPMSAAMAAPPTGFATPGNGCSPNDPRAGYIDCNAAKRAAEQRAAFEAEQRRQQEANRIRQQQINQANAQRAAENQRQITEYRLRMEQQQRQQQAQQQQQQNQQQQQVNDQIRSSGAVRVNAYADQSNRPHFTAFNNTDVWLQVKVSYDLRGDDGAYQRGEESCVAPAHASCDNSYFMGSVSDRKHWTVSNTNVTWAKWN